MCYIKYSIIKCSNPNLLQLIKFTCHSLTEIHEIFKTKWPASVHLWHLKVKWYYFGRCGYKSPLHDEAYWTSPNLNFKERKYQLNFGAVSKTGADRWTDMPTNRRTWHPHKVLPFFFLLFCKEHIPNNYLGGNFKLLKPTVHVMHQQFNIQQLYALPTLYLYVLHLSHNKQRLVPLTP